MFTQDINCLQWIDRFVIPKTTDDLSWEELDEDNRESLVVFDVGMNKGESSLLCLNYFSAFKIKVHGFEPNKFMEFHPNLNNFKEKIVVNETAVSNVSTTQTLYVPTKHNDKSSSSALSSLVNRPIFSTWDDVHVAEHVTNVVTIDQYCETNKIEKINYLKIDVEGLELNVLKGAQTCLKNKVILAGQFEYGSTLTDNKTSLSDIVAYLFEHEYSCFLGPVHETNKFTLLNVDELIAQSPDHWENIIFIQNDLLVHSNN